jgi:hypothetical protein
MPNREYTQTHRHKHMPETHHATRYSRRRHFASLRVRIQMLKLPPLGLNGRDFACSFRYKLYLKDKISCLHVKVKDSEPLKV